MCPQVNINEPVSMLQRMMEHVYYADLLTQASQAPTTLEELPYLAAFVLSAYPHTIYRMAKPFNPLLGETYECDRRAECGWRSFMEQVSGREGERENLERRRKGRREGRREREDCILV